MIAVALRTVLLPSRYYVPNPAYKGGSWFGRSSHQPACVDPGYQSDAVVAAVTCSSPSQQQQSAGAGNRSSSGRVVPPKELELLKGVSGHAVPGKLMALMGGSGAGRCRSL